MKLNLKLNTRYKRSIKKNLIFYIAASLLTMLCVMAFALLYTCGNGIKNYVFDMFDKCVVEDANVETLSSIEDNEIIDFEKRYHLLMEKQESLNIIDVKAYNDANKLVSENDTHARIFKNNTKINKYVITEQKSNVNLKTVNDLKDNEIIINEKYADRHKLSLEKDNKIILDEKEFHIVGYFVRPDYLNGLESTTDAYANYDTFFIGYINNNIYDTLKDQKDGKISATSVYSLKYNQNGTTDVDALRKELFNNYITYQYNVAQTSGRIKTFYTRPQLFISFSFLFLIILPLAVVSIIAIILNIKIKNDQKIIGTAEALGYREKEICYHYSIMSMIPGLIGGTLMTIIVYISSKFFGKLSTGDYEVMKIDFIYPWYMAILGILIPTIIYVIASILTVKRLINKPVTDLLRGAGRKSKGSNILIHKRAKITSKYALRSLLINKGRTVVVFLGIMASALIISISLMMLDTIDAIVTQAMKKAGDFEYEYTLKMPTITEDDYNKEEYNYMIATIYEYDDRKIPLMGADSSNMNLWYTTLTDGTKITELDDNSFYMSKLCAELMHVKAGDTVTIYSNFNKDKLEFKISGIIDNGLLSYILTNKKNVISSYFKTIESLLDSLELESELNQALKEYLDGNKDSDVLNKMYNIVLSKKALNDQYDSENIINIFQKSSIEKQKDAKLKERTPIIYLVLVIGISICIIAVFTVVNVIIEDNQGNISMLMVLGYSNKEINKMIFNGNHILVPLGIGVGMPLAFGILNFFFQRTIPNNNMIMPVYLKLSTGLIIIATIVITYALTLFVLKKKASRVNMTDSLKDNR